MSKGPLSIEAFADLLARDMDACWEELCGLQAQEIARLRQRLQTRTPDSELVALVSELQDKVTFLEFRLAAKQ